jgi:cellulose synthase/poly-beta-1,6-N-acetylglucosamine synthase-like glycosyltransferase
VVDEQGTNDIRIPKVALIITALLTASAVVLFALVLLFALEIVIGLFFGYRVATETPQSAAPRRPMIAVIVPAHNESAGVLPTIADIRAQLTTSDRLIVVADNCVDDTAAVSAAAGAEVVARHDPINIGKGYALARGVEHLESSPPEIVVMIDADCRVADEALECLAATCLATGRPVQALYLMGAAKDSPASTRVAQFAWRVKNWARPLGLSALGLPCQLMGSGMAIPWSVISSVDLATGEITEDLKLGLDLTRARAAPVFCPSAVVTSQFSSSTAGARTQRLRWEKGHIGLLLTAAPKLLYAGAIERNPNLCWLALDLAIPPLSLLAMLLLSMLAVSSVAASISLNWIPFWIAATTVVLFVGSLFVSWCKYGMEVVSAREVLRVLFYAFAKLPMYTAITLRRTQVHWTRTDRTSC